MIAQEQIRWQPLGAGRIAPQGSIADRALAERLATYKRQVAGRYRSVSPADLVTALPPGPYILSPKLDGETWFLHAADGEARLLSPTGRVIADVPVTEEAGRLFAGRGALLAGELYANGRPTRPRVHDLHAAMGGGAEASVEHLHFAAFDLLDEDGQDAQSLPFPQRAGRLTELLRDGSLCHCVPFEHAAGPRGVLDAYARLVTNEGHEGLVIRCADGQIIKVKPEITIDAAVVGFTERATGGVAELLLALLRPNGAFQLLGRVDTGFTEADRREMVERLRPLVVDSSYLAASRAGVLFRFVRPELVVEAKCNDLLAVRANGESVRRMALAFDPDASPPWGALRPLSAASMIHAVFRRVRHDIRENVGPRRHEAASHLPTTTCIVTAPVFRDAAKLLNEAASRQFRRAAEAEQLGGWSVGGGWLLSVPPRSLQRAHFLARWSGGRGNVHCPRGGRPRAKRCAR